MRAEDIRNVHRYSDDELVDNIVWLAFNNGRDVSILDGDQWNSRIDTMTLMKSELKQRLRENKQCTA
jgi:hypothetical protein